MALEQHNTASEFESMLRRHLQQGGTPVAPCVGFDADLASAYLERALSPRTHSQFEVHLAGCAACRQHVVALARLADLLPVAQPAVAAVAPVTVPQMQPLGAAAEPVWGRWRNAVAGWFDFSAWNLGWTATATACGLLLAVLGARTWQQSRVVGEPSSSVVASNALSPTSAAVEPGLPNQAAGDLAASADSGLLAANLNAPPPANELSLSKQDASVSPHTTVVPRPVTLPAASLLAGAMSYPSQPEVKVLPPMASGEVNFGSQPVPPPALNAVSTVGQFNLNSPSLALPVRLNSGAPVRQAAPFITLPVESDSKELAADLVFPKSRDRRRIEKESEPVSSLRNRDLLNTLRGRANSFMPFSGPDKDAEARTKEANVKAAQAESRMLMKRLNGHVFYFENGFWIDEEYKSDTKLPLKRLVRGSDEYQQAQIENPSLEQFFQLGQVIVVWKGVVYEVRK